MNDDRARSRWVLLGQTRPCAHSRRGCRRTVRSSRSSAACRAGSGCGGRRARSSAVAEGVARRVALGVVGHHRLDRAAALLGEPVRRRVAAWPRRCARSRRRAARSRPGGCGRRSTPMHDRLAGAARLRCCSRAIAGRPMPGPIELRQLRRRRCAAARRPRPIHSARASGARSSAAGASSHGAPGPSRSSSGAGRSGTAAASAPVRLRPRLQDRLLRPRRSAPKDTTADRRPRAQTRPRRPLCSRRLRQRCHHRCAVAGATPRAAAAALNVAPCSISSTSSKRPPVRACTYGPPCPAPFGDAVVVTAPSVGGRTTPQTFTKSVGSSASPRRAPSTPAAGAARR